MIYNITTMDKIDKRKLMDIYREGNMENTDYFYPEIADKEQAVAKVESDFLKYIETDFLSSSGNVYWVLEENAVWVSALRLYRVDNALYYIEALETHPDFRGQGHASKLLDSVINELKKQGSFRLCDCVSKKNTASIRTHEKCGFRVVSEEGFDYLSNEADDRHYGMEYLWVNGLFGDSDTNVKKVVNLDQFVMPATERGQDADKYIRELRVNERLQLTE